ncbi:MAG: hotdog fold thioesterase [Saprospiraceae bacterium]|nr:hotdog fold thioesterase [Saprospiraceae bacterium]
MLWKQAHDLAVLRQISQNTLVDTLGIEFTEVGQDFITARMPVDHRTVQPMRLLHGGASVALAETLGSVASVLCLDDPASQAPVGVEINANHLNSAKEGAVVYGTARPLKIGRRLHVWNIEIKDESGKLICVSRITIAVVERR